LIHERPAKRPLAARLGTGRSIPLRAYRPDRRRAFAAKGLACQLFLPDKQDRAPPVCRKQVKQLSGGASIYRIALPSPLRAGSICDCARQGSAFLV